MISVELWDASRPDELVSAEVGVVVGRCYVCLSLFARTDEYPRCEWVRAQASVLLLRRLGVELFDAGTTASYYATHFGFRRCASRQAFLELWRSRRTQPRVPVAGQGGDGGDGGDVTQGDAMQVVPEASEVEPGAAEASEASVASGLLCGGGIVCDDVRSLLESYQLETAAPSSADLEARRRAAKADGGGAERPARPQKATVRISGLGSVLAAGALDADRLAAALARALPAVTVADVGKVAIVDRLGAAFVTFATQQAATAALTLDGCALPMAPAGGEAEPGAATGGVAAGGDDDVVAPIVEVAAHGRKAKARPRPKEGGVGAAPAAAAATSMTAGCGVAAAAGLSEGENGAQPQEERRHERSASGGGNHHASAVAAALSVAPCAGGSSVALSISLG